MSNNSQPLDIFALTEDQLNDELNKGYADISEGRIKPAEDIFADIRKNVIEYKTDKNLPCEKLYQLFVAVGWADETATTQSMIENFNKPFVKSTIVISAWHNDILVGCIRALSDTMFRSVIYDLAVLPEFQKQGIGTQLVKRCMGIYPDSEWVLETIPERISFYESIGFELNRNPVLKIPCKYFE